MMLPSWQGAIHVQLEGTTVVEPGSHGPSPPLEGPTPG